MADLARVKKCDLIPVVNEATDVVLDKLEDALTVSTFANSIMRIKRGRGSDNWGYFIDMVIEEMKDRGYVVLLRPDPDPGDPDAPVPAEVLDEADC